MQEHYLLSLLIIDTSRQVTIENLKNIKQLEALFRAHTLMAVISGHGMPSHEQHCLMAYAFVIRIWQVRRYRLLLAIVRCFTVLIYQLLFDFDFSSVSLELFINCC